ncbi:MAG: cadherin-like domain-containing protein, partial [Thermoguttaceae bacterium]
MSMFRNVKGRTDGLFSGHGTQRGKGHGKKPANRRSRALGLESLENRQLLSVSPGMMSDDACFLAPSAGDTGWDDEPAALVSTMDPAAGAAGQEGGAAPIVAGESFAMTSTQQLGSGVLANDVDPDGDTLTVTLASNVAHGRLALEPNGLFTYRPDGQFDGVETFTYTVSDGVNQAGPSTVTIQVSAAESHAPDAVDDAYALAEDGSLTVDRPEGLLANDSDADGDPLYAHLVQGPEHGTLTVGRYGSFTYTPEPNFSGTDRFTYTAGDLDAESQPATVLLAVAPVNDTPAAIGDAYSASEDQVLVVDAAQGVLANDADPDGDSLVASVVQEPSQGTLSQ